MYQNSLKISLLRTQPRLTRPAGSWFAPRRRASPPGERVERLHLQGEGGPPTPELLCGHQQPRGTPPPVHQSLAPPPPLAQGFVAGPVGGLSKLFINSRDKGDSQCWRLEIFEESRSATVNPSSSLVVSMDTRLQKVLRSSDSKSAPLTLHGTTRLHIGRELGTNVV
jgi:hypothetical protein